MSLTRSRKDGSSRRRTFRRKYRSSLNMPRSTQLRRSLFVAAMMRTSSLSSFLLPMRDTTPSSRKRRRKLCHVKRHLGYLVEEDGAAVGLLELAGRAAFARSCERALLVAEQLAADELFGDGAAVDGEERRVFARAGIVDGLREHLLAGAAFAGDQHVARAGSRAGGVSLARRNAGASPLMSSNVNSADLDALLRAG